MISLLLALAAGAPLAQESAGRELGPRQTGEWMEHAAAVAVGRDEAIRGAVDWLVANQNENGSWGSHHSPRPIEVLCDVPGSHHAFRVGTTGLGVIALADSPYRTEASRRALDRGVDYLLDDWQVKRASGLEHYSVWAFGYTLHALGERLLAEPDDPRAPAMRAVCEAMVEKLGRYQALDGGWGYLSLEPPTTYQPSFTSMSFTTATILVGVDRARRAGVAVPQKMIDRAVASIERCETPNDVFTYGELWRMSPHRSVNTIQGAACRTPLLYEALELFGEGRETAIYSKSLENLLIDTSSYQVAGLRRPMPHESHHGISGYFYLYGHAYAAYQMERLSAREQERFAPLLERAVLICRQPDGSFWDYPLYSYHKPYGTAFALIALARTAPTSPPAASAQ